MQQSLLQLRVRDMNGAVIREGGTGCDITMSMLTVEWISLD